MSVKPYTLFTNDNLPIMRGMDDESIDLIYLDPPFNKKKDFIAPIGSTAEGAEFKDWWTMDDVKAEEIGEIGENYPAVSDLINTAGDISGKSHRSYLIVMAIRLIEMKRLLRNTGSIYLHCDPTMGHWLKLVMDSIFGSKNFRNEIVWKRKDNVHNRAQQSMGKNYDVIHWYAKSPKANYNRQYTPYDDEYIDTHYKHEDSRGRYATFPLTNEAGGNKPYTFRGINRSWRWSKEKMGDAYQSGLLTQTKPDAPWRYKKYLNEADGVPIQSLWDDIKPASSKKERTGYPTQKPVALLERIISASSNEGDVVFDPFCGCATALVAAERLNRKWIGIDQSKKAVELVNIRMKKETNLFDRYKPIFRSDIPTRAGGKQSPEIKTILYGQQAGFCAICGYHFRYQNLTIDHITPKKKGGGEEDSNKQLLCGHCNSVKGGKRTNAEAKARLKEITAEYAKGL